MSEPAHKETWFGYLPVYLPVRKRPELLRLYFNIGVSLKSIEITEYWNSIPILAVRDIQQSLYSVMCDIKL